MVRFGSLGQYSSEAQTKEQARRYFLEAVREVCPEVLVNLRARPFATYQAWAKRAEGMYPRPSSGTVHPVFRSYMLLQQLAPEVADAIAEWGQRFHLIGEQPKPPAWHGEQWHEFARAESLWPWQKALEALYVWHWLRGGSQLSNAVPPRWPSVRTLETRTADRFTVHLEVPAYAPDQESTAAAYVKQVLATAKGIVREHVELQKYRAQTGGQRWTVKKSAPEHFEWLALRQVKGWCDRQVADWHRCRTELAVTPDTVRHGIGLAAGLIQLKLRQFKRGRPPAEIRKS